MYCDRSRSGVTVMSHTDQAVTSDIVPYFGSYLTFILLLGFLSLMFVGTVGRFMIPDLN